MRIDINYHLWPAKSFGMWHDTVLGLRYRPPITCSMLEDLMDDGPGKWTTETMLEIGLVFISFSIVLSWPGKNAPEEGKVPAQSDVACPQIEAAENEGMP